MKMLLAVMLFLSAQSVLAFNSHSVFNGVSEEFCPESLINHNTDTLFCKASNAKEVMSAKVGKNLTEKEAKLSFLGFSLWNATDAGIVPDADSNTAYFYASWLVNSKGQKVGVKTIEGWYNTEMESSARFYIWYNLKGQVVKAETREGLKN